MLIDRNLAETWKPRRGLGSLLILMLLAGILAGIIAPRAERQGFPADRLINIAFVAFTVLLLAFCVVLLTRSVGLYRKHGNKSLVLSGLGSTALVLGILLSQLVPENKAVMGGVYGLFAVSITVSIRGMIVSKKAIARLEAGAAERERETPRE